VAFFVLPLVGLVQQAPWGRLVRELGSQEVREALRVSAVAASGAVALSLLFGVPLALLLARAEFPGKSLVRALTTLPMVLPPVVGGIALLLAFGRRGVAGVWLDRAFGVSLPFTTAATVLAATFVAMPFFVLTVESGLRAMDRRLEDAAATLGASRWRALFTVTLPLIAPSLGAGAALCWVRALGEFGATITFAGNLPGTTQTMPLAAYLELETRVEGAIALSLLLLAFSLSVLVLLRDRWFPRA
jgi:molybdate transport system permease protein